MYKPVSLEKYCFRTIFGNEICVSIRDSVYTIESVELSKVPENVLKELTSQITKPSELITKLLERDDLEPSQKFTIFQELTFGLFTIPLMDPYVRNININERVCIITHSEAGDVIYGVNYSGEDVEKFVQSLCLEIGKTLTIRKPILEASIEFLDSIFRISITGRSDIAPMYQISIRKHPRRFWTLVDQIKTGFIDVKSSTLLAVNFALPTSMSMIVSGVMGSRKTTLLGCLLQFTEPNCIIGILQEDPELDITYMPYTYIEWHCCRKAMVGAQIEEITLIDLIKIALRKNYRKIIIAEVRKPEEIYQFIQLLKVTHGAATTVHALSLDTVIQRLLKANYGDLKVDETDLEPIRLITITGLVMKKPKLLETWYVNIPKGIRKLMIKFDGKIWQINEDIVNEYLQDLANLNNIPVNELYELCNNIERLLSELSRRKVELDHVKFRKIIIDLYTHGLEKAIEEIKYLV